MEHITRVHSDFLNPGQLLGCNRHVNAALAPSPVDRQSINWTGSVPEQISFELRWRVNGAEG
jgi:hypothetical protein